MSAPDILATVTPVVDLFERMNVGYSIAGSVASSAHGIARATLDVDLVADLKPGHADVLVAALEEAYYIDRGAVEDAISRQSMFNVVHLETMLKVDVYVLPKREFDQESFRRRQQGALEDVDDARLFFIDTPEDTVLHKLEWYRAGDEVSERQWDDVVGVLKVQKGALQLDYLRQWASRLEVLDLLERALRAAE